MLGRFFLRKSGLEFFLPRRGGGILDQAHFFIRGVYATKSTLPCVARQVFESNDKNTAKSKMALFISLIRCSKVLSQETKVLSQETKVLSHETKVLSIKIKIKRAKIEIF